jgi:hypothetical protein
MLPAEICYSLLSQFAGKQMPVVNTKDSIILDLIDIPKMAVVILIKAKFALIFANPAYCPQLCRKVRGSNCS